MALGNTVRKNSYLKTISQSIQNFLNLYSYHAYFILWDKSKNVLQEEMKDWTF